MDTNFDQRIVDTLFLSILSRLFSKCLAANLDEILLLPFAELATIALGSRRLPWQDCGLRVGQNGRRRSTTQARYVICTHEIFLETISSLWAHGCYSMKTDGCCSLIVSLLSFFLLVM